MLVTFAGQGVMKNAPISSSETPFFLENSRFAMAAATSMGDSTSTILSISSGNRTRMSRIIAGQAEDMSGCLSVVLSFSRTAAETTSAPFATSKTSSKPKRRKAEYTCSGLDNFFS